jgi:hypothetical protein
VGIDPRDGRLKSRSAVVSHLGHVNPEQWIQVVSHSRGSSANPRRDFLRDPRFPTQRNRHCRLAYTQAPGDIGNCHRITLGWLRVFHGWQTMTVFSKRARVAVQNIRASKRGNL